MENCKFFSQFGVDYQGRTSIWSIFETVRFWRYQREIQEFGSKVGPFDKSPLLDGIGSGRKTWFILWILWSDQAVACKFDFEIIVIFTKMLQNALGIDGQKGVKKRTVINLRGMEGVGDVQSSEFGQVCCVTERKSTVIHDLHVIKVAYIL